MINRTIPTLRPGETITLTSGVRGNGFSLSIWHGSHLVAATILDRETVRTLGQHATEMTHDGPLPQRIPGATSAHAMDLPREMSYAPEPAPGGAFRLVPKENHPGIDDTIRQMGARYEHLPIAEESRLALDPTERMVSDWNEHNDHADDRPQDEE